MFLFRARGPKPILWLANVVAMLASTHHENALAGAFLQRNCHFCPNCEFRLNRGVFPSQCCNRKVKWPSSICTDADLYSVVRAICLYHDILIREIIATNPSMIKCRSLLSNDSLHSQSQRDRYVHVTLSHGRLRVFAVRTTTRCFTRHFTMSKSESSSCTITRRKITKLTPKQFWFGNSSTQITE